MDALESGAFRMSYDKIKLEYRKLMDNLLSQGRLPVKDTEKGFWAISVPDDIKALFDRIGLNKYKSFIDLGSGDGRVAMIAALYTASHGIEHDNELHEIAAKVKYNLRSDAILYNEDFMKFDLKGYDFIFIHPDQSLVALENKLKSEFRGTLVVYGNEFLPLSIPRKDLFYAGTTPVNVYDVRST